jgi:hypothetical protein
MVLGDSLSQCHCAWSVGGMVLGDSLSQCHCTYQTFHTERPGVEAVRGRQLTT